MTFFPTKISNWSGATFCQEVLWLHLGYSYPSDNIRFYSSCLDEWISESFSPPIFQKAIGVELMKRIHWKFHNQPLSLMWYAIRIRRQSAKSRQSGWEKWTLFMYVLTTNLCLDMSFAAGAFTSNLRSGGGGGGGDGGRRLFSRVKDAGGKEGKDGSGPSPITAQLMFQAMVSNSPGGISSGSANKDQNAKDQHDQSNLVDHCDRKNQGLDPRKEFNNGWAMLIYVRECRQETADFSWGHSFYAHTSLYLAALFDMISLWLQCR